MNAQAQILNCDVVVVGGGGSGLAAAIEAAVSGASVVVLEKEASLRGSTGRSVGAIAASRTPDQRQLGVDDTPELHLADYRKLSGDRAASENEDLARLLVNNVTETLAWLRGLGVEFFGPVEGAGHSAPRLHNALPGSQAYIYHLRKRARRLGVRVLLNTAVERINHIDGSVTGVEARTRDGREVRARARRAVVLTTGDFSASAEMKRTYLGDRYAGFLPVNPAATGDAQRMAAQMGGEVINGDLIDLPTLRLAPPAAEGWFGLLQKIPPGQALTKPIKWGLKNVPGKLVRPAMLSFVTTYLSPRETLFDHGAILIDRQGEWKKPSGESISLTVAELGEDGGYIIGDQSLFERFSSGDNFVASAPGVARAYMPDFRRSRKDVFAEASDLPTLAAKLGIAGDVLEGSVAQANAATDSSPQIMRPPYFALGPVRAYVIQTKGGLRISTNMEVVTAGGTPIPGLFAAGNAGQGGLALNGYGHHLAWAFTSGRIAGRNAAHRQSVE